MISNMRLALAGLLLAVSATATAQMPAVLDGQAVPSLAPLVERASPAVVNIRVSHTVTQRNPFGDDPFWRFFGGPNVPGGQAKPLVPVPVSSLMLCVATSSRITTSSPTPIQSR